MSGKARNGSQLYSGAYMWLCYKIIHSGLSYVKIGILQATFPNMIFFSIIITLKIILPLKHKWIHRHKTPFK